MPLLEPHLRDWIERVALPGRTVIAARLLTGGYSNDNRMITTADGGEFVLRRYLGNNRCAVEAALAARLAGVVPVAEVVASDPDGSATGEPVLLSAFVRGQPLGEVLAGVSGAENAELGTATGRVLAAVGSVSFAAPGFFADAALEPGPPGMEPTSGLAAFVESCLREGNAAGHLTDVEQGALLDFAAAAAPDLAVLDGSARLVHADFNPKNIVAVRRAGHWRVAAVLDWEFAFSSSPLFDVGNMLRDPRPAGFTDAFVRGFLVGGGELPAGWRRLSQAVDLISLADLLRRPTDHRYFARSLERIRELIRPCSVSRPRRLGLVATRTRHRAPLVVPAGHALFRLCHCRDGSPPAGVRHPGPGFVVLRPDEPGQAGNCPGAEHRRSESWDSRRCADESQRQGRPHRMVDGCGSARGLLVADPVGVGFFLVDGGGLHSFDATTGTKVWRYRGDRRDFGSGGSLPTVHLGGAAVVIAGDFSTAVVSRESGVLLWARRSTGGSQASAFVADDVLLTASDGSRDQSAVVSASRLRDGALLWERQLSAEHCSTVGTARGVAVLNVGGLGPGAQTVGLQLSTGRDLWRSTRPAVDAWDSPSTVLGSRIAYFQHPAPDALSAARSELVIRDLHTGRLITVDRRLSHSATEPSMRERGRYFAVVSDHPDSEFDCLALIDLREAGVLYRRDIDLRPVGTPVVTSAGRPVCTLAPINTATAASAALSSHG